MTMKLFSSILFVVLFFMDNNSVQCYRPFHVIEMFLNESKTAFSTFKRDFRVSYHSVEEEARRFLIFAENYFYVALNNKHYNQGKVSYKMGINEFSDKKDHELKALRGFKPTLLKHPKSHIASFHMRSAVNQTLPQSVDWRELGAVTGVKNQGHCGSCWAFSTTGSLEGQHFRKSGKLVSLSEQQLVDCSAEYGNNGCNGGLMDNAFSYIKDNGGIDTEQAYPYISGNTSKQEKTCNYRKNFIGAKDTGFVDIESGNEEALKEALANVGPISVAIDASQPGFMGYREGVYTDDMCQNGPMNLDHGVLLVGYGVDKSEKGDDVEYWLVKNSWGHLWGLQGYIKMRRGYNNMCGIATTASYPLV